MWLTPISVSDLVMVMTDPELADYFLVRPPLSSSVSQQQTLTPVSRPTPTKRSSISLPGVWVPPIELHTPARERLFGYTPNGLLELWSEIRATLVVSPSRK